MSLAPNPLGLPRYPGRNICPRFAHHESCAFGRSCPCDHPPSKSLFKKGRIEKRCSGLLGHSWQSRTLSVSSVGIAYSKPDDPSSETFPWDRIEGINTITMDGKLVLVVSVMPVLITSKAKAKSRPAGHGPGHGPGHGVGHEPGLGPGHGVGHGPGHGPAYGPGHGVGHGSSYGPGLDPRWAELDPPPPSARRKEFNDLSRVKGGRSIFFRGSADSQTEHWVDLIQNCLTSLRIHLVEEIVRTKKVTAESNPIEGDNRMQSRENGSGGGGGGGDGGRSGSGGGEDGNGNGNGNGGRNESEGDGVDGGAVSFDPAQSEEAEETSSESDDDDGDGDFHQSVSNNSNGATRNNSQPNPVPVPVPVLVPVSVPIAPSKPPPVVAPPQQSAMRARPIQKPISPIAPLAAKPPVTTQTTPYIAKLKSRKRYLASLQGPSFLPSWVAENFYATRILSDGTMVTCSNIHRLGWLRLLALCVCLVPLLFFILPYTRLFVLMVRYQRDVDTWAANHKIEIPTKGEISNLTAIMDSLQRWREDYPKLRDGITNNTALHDSEYDFALTTTQALDKETDYHHWQWLSWLALYILALTVLALVTADPFLVTLGVALNLLTFFLLLRAKGMSDGLQDLVISMTLSVVTRLQRHQETHRKKKRKQKK